MNCYGSKQHGHLERCKNCTIENFCKEAIAPPSYALDFNTHQLQDIVGDDFCFFDETHVTSLENSVQTKQLSAYSIRSFIQNILVATKADPIRTFIIMGRLGGLSQSEIGRTCGMTKQAISKHVQVMKNGHPDLGRFLQLNFASNEDFESVFSSATYDVRRNDGRRNKE